MEKIKIKRKTGIKKQELLTKKEWLARFFGKVKSFWDEREYQKGIRNGQLGNTGLR